MILTVTLNPAWDVTYTVERLEPGSTHRPAAVTARPGGKGVNVSRVLHQLGYATVATGLVAGPAGRELRAELAAAGISESFHECGEPSGAQTRRTLTIVENGSGRATVLAEPGPPAGSVHWAALLLHLDALIEGCDLVVLSGSLPAAVPADAYRTLTDHAHVLGVPVILDAGGAALMAALPARPDLVKPNTAELYEATGSREPVEGGRLLLEAGAVRVVVSAGPDGLTGLDADGIWRAVPPSLLPVNPTGAGDAAVAALAVGLTEGRDWPHLLRTAAAWSAAAVLEPCAGAVAADRIGELAAAATVTAIANDRSVPQC